MNRVSSIIEITDYTFVLELFPDTAITVSLTNILRVSFHRIARKSLREVIAVLGLSISG